MVNKQLDKIMENYGFKYNKRLNLWQEEDNYDNAIHNDMIFEIFDLGFNHKNKINKNDT